MAVTVDNTIARVTASSGGLTATSGSFDVAAGDGIIIAGCCDQDSDATVDSMAISDNQTPDLGWTLGPSRGTAEGTSGLARFWYYHSAGAITGLTVTLTTASQNNTPSIKPYKVTGHDSADMLGPVSEGGLTTDPLTTTAITSETAGAFYAAWVDWNQTGAPTSSDLTISTINVAGRYSGASGYKTPIAAASSITGNINSGGTPTGNWVCMETRVTAAAATDVPPLPRIPWHAVYRAATI